MKYNKNIARSAMMITQFGINMLVPIFLCTFLGMFLDKLFGTSFLVIVLFFLGALAGFTNIFRLAKQLYEEKNPNHINYYKVEGNEDTSNDRETAER